jgi:hypothetical protein
MRIDRMGEGLQLEAPGRSFARLLAAPAATAAVTWTERLPVELESAQRRLDRVLELASSGRAFSPAELLALQVDAGRASLQLELGGKLVEKGAAGVRQVLQTAL